MGDLVKRGLPGLAVALVAISSVLVFDKAFGPETTSAGAVDPTDMPNGTNQPTAPAPEASTPTEPVDECANPDSSEGPEIDTPWGPVQVVVRGTSSGTICSVEAVAYPTGDRKSASINSRAIPQLEQMATQSGTEFDSISGATYTSEAYRDSLQEALDKL